MAKAIDCTTKIFRARGLHLDDRHVRDIKGVALSASVVDVTTYVVNNYQNLQAKDSSIVLYLPKIQTAEEAALWNKILSTLEDYLELPSGTIKVYVLVEQLEATFQLMEIRAALGVHFVGYNTGRWDYINSVADAVAWNHNFINPNIESITMTYGYMKNYEDRVRRAVNTPISTEILLSGKVVWNPTYLLAQNRGLLIVWRKLSMVLSESNLLVPVVNG